MLLVPVHGSFWLATHPGILHPRSEELLRDGSFVFGNGGVGRIVATADESVPAQVGDYVTVFGHSPCGHSDCHACTQLHRYTECDYGLGTILGHGKGANDGTYASHAILPPFSYEVIQSGGETPSEDDLIPFMYGFLMADVRNALTRHPETLLRNRMLLIGAGLSGHFAARLFLESSAQARVVVVERCSERAASLRSLAPNKVSTCIPPASLVDRLEERAVGPDTERELAHLVEEVSETMTRRFGGRGCDLIFDSSSGNSAPIWNTPQLVPPACHCIPFGFGSDRVCLDRDSLQTSGLAVLVSRGVGTLENRRAVIGDLLADRSRFVQRHLLPGGAPPRGPGGGDRVRSREPAAAGTSP